MKKFNIILVYDEKKENILMCERKKEPYKGKLNLVGGKVEENENELDAAYRELYEETCITKKDICLKHLMNLQYKVQDIELEVYAGKCFTTTAQHLQNIKQLDTIEDLLKYDYTAKYPNKIILNENQS